MAVNSSGEYLEELLPCMLVKVPAESFFQGTWPHLLAIGFDQKTGSDLGTGNES